MANAKISRRSVEIDIDIEKGSTFRQTLTWKEREPPKTPIDLTGCTARMQIRDKKKNNSILYEMTTENGGISLGSTNGTVELYISDTDSTAWAFKEGIYDLEIIFPNTDVRRLIRGKIVVFDEVTR